MASEKCKAKDPATCRYHSSNNDSQVINLGKTCTKCQKKKPLGEFSKNKTRPDGFQVYCKACVVEINKSYYKNTPAKNEARKGYLTNRKALVEQITLPLKEKGCYDCGEYVKDAMEFDHVRGVKTFNISELHQQKMDTSTMLNSLKEELEKCDICCANCHRIRTLERYGTSQRKEFLKNPNSPLINLKARLIYSEMLKSGCVDCGTKDLRVLEFDHISGSKVKALSKMIQDNDFSLADVNQEIAKCESRCVNCHRIKSIARARKIEATLQLKNETPQTSQICKCGKPKSRSSKVCSDCRNKSRTKASYPAEVSILVNMIKTTSWEEVAAIFKVSSNAIRKYLRNRNIDIKNL